MLEDSPSEMDRCRFADHVYASVETAVKVMSNRRSSRGLHRFERELEIPIPAVLQDTTPVGVVFRQVASPNYELRRLFRLTRDLQMKLIVWEFHDDRFLTRNRSKYSLGRLGFYSGLGRQGGRKTEYVKVIDLNENNGCRFCEISTIWGERFIDFHHKLLFSEFPDYPKEYLFDASEWFKSRGTMARNYYKAFISLFIEHAILFETFILKGDEREFTKKVFLPAFDSLTEQFGAKPLIVRTEPEEWEGDEFWELYPQHLRRHLGPYRVQDTVALKTGAQWVTPNERDVLPLGPHGIPAMLDFPIFNPCDVGPPAIDHANLKDEESELKRATNTI